MEILRAAVRGPDGRLVVCIPARNLLNDVESRPALAFDDFARSVSFGRKVAKLYPSEYGTFKLAWQRGEVSHEELQELVWGAKTATSGAISGAVSGANTKLMDADIPAFLLNSNSRVSAGNSGKI